jgi:hypothetical protein
MELCTVSNSRSLEVTGRLQNDPEALPQTPVRQNQGGHGEEEFVSNSGVRLMRIMEMLAAGIPGQETTRLCQVCAEVSGMSGAGIMLMADDSPRASVCSTDGVCELIEHLQFTLGEGPSVDAYHHQVPVLEPNLAAPTSMRWLAFSGPTVDAGVQAIFGFPIRVGEVRLGALNLYRDRPGSLTDEQHADSLVLADIAARAMLMLQSNAPVGSLAVELEAGASFPYLVHQATGMVAAQLDASVGVALVRLRAYSFAHERPLQEVAREVVARALRFQPDD